MKNYAEEERLLSQPQEKLISSSTLQNGTLITPLMLFNLQMGLVCTKTGRFNEYTPKKCFNSFVQSAVDARMQDDGSSNSSVVVETMKLLANSSYGYQIMDRSRQTVTKYHSDEKTHAAINSKLFKRLDHMNNSLYEVELAKAQVEHKEPINVGFFILQYAKLRMLELYYNFFTRCCDVKQVRRVGNRQRVVVPCSCRERTGRLYKTWNESWMAEVAIQWLCRQFHCWFCSKFLPQNMLCETQTTW